MARPSSTIRSTSSVVATSPAYAGHATKAPTSASWHRPGRTSLPIRSGSSDLRVGSHLSCPLNSCMPTMHMRSGDCSRRVSVPSP